MTTFSAAPQTLGYLFQVRLALLKLLDEDESASLRIEALDDIEIAAGTSTQLLQLKHRAHGTTITTGSPDLWKSIRVWAEQLKAGAVVPEHSVFVLLSTAKATADSFASRLKDDDERNPAEALTLASAFAATSKNEQLAAAIKAFNALTPPQREALFDRIFVYDETSTILDVRSKIEARLKTAVARQHRGALADRVEGWWLRVCIEHLSGKRPSISGFELVDHIAFLAQHFSNESLPIDCYAIKPGAAQANDLQGHIFVEQLERIGISSARIQNAVLDYYRAFTQRSRWIRDQLLVDSELERYEERLFDEWNRVRLALEQNIGEAASDATLIALGQQLLDWAELTADIPIRPKVTESYVMRGTFHMLADETPPRIRWHRNFAATIKAAIAQSAK